MNFKLKKFVKYIMRGH